MERQVEEDRRDLQTRERVLQTIVSAVHGAAGNKKGAEKAFAIRLLSVPLEERLPSYEAARRMFPEDPLYPVEGD